MSVDTCRTGSEMSTWASLRGLMKQTVTYEPFATHSSPFDDAPTYGTSRILRARVVEQTKLVRADDGKETISGRVAWVDEEDATITNRDRLTLPDGTQPAIVRVERSRDSTNRIATTKVFLT